MSRLSLLLHESEAKPTMSAMQQYNNHDQLLIVSNKHVLFISFVFRYTSKDFGAHIQFLKKSRDTLTFPIPVYGY